MLFVNGEQREMFYGSKERARLVSEIVFLVEDDNPDNCGKLLTLMSKYLGADVALAGK